PAATLKAAGAALDAADPMAALRGLAEHAESPTGKAEYLEEATSASSDTSLSWALERWDEETGTSTPMPWAELLEIYGKRPLHDRFAADLPELDGCPSELATAGREAAARLAHPGYTPRRGKTPPTLAEMVRTLPLSGAWMEGNCRWLQQAYESGQVGLDEIVHTAHPALPVVSFLGRNLRIGIPNRQDTAEEVDGITGTLRDLAAEHLNADPEAWALVLRLLPEFEGSVPELLATAGAVVS
ncbi:MAG: hypothetical protein LBV60_15310, partial [Streptomyces sp.]|nr:hypothetical protein [Streptomyces sp.]